MHLQNYDLFKGLYEYFVLFSCHKSLLPELVEMLMPVNSPLVSSPLATVAAIAATRCCNSTNVVGGARGLGISSIGLRASPLGGAGVGGITVTVEPANRDLWIQLVTDLAGLTSVVGGRGLLELARTGTQEGTIAGGTCDWFGGWGALFSGFGGCMLNCSWISGTFNKNCRMSLCWSLAPKRYGVKAWLYVTGYSWHLTLACTHKPLSIIYKGT